MHVLFDTSPLNTGHSHRGIGMYTSLLVEELKKISEIEVSTTKDEARSKKKKIDVVHYPYFDLFFHTLPIIKPAAKSVVTIHDVIPLQLKDHYPVGKKGKVSFIAQKVALSTVSAVITDSISSKLGIETHLGIPSKKISVVYLAANPELTKQTDKRIGDLKQKYNLPDKYLLYVGDINYNKNLPQLIKSLKFLPDDLHLVFFGKNFHAQQIPEWQWLETQIALSNVSSRVHFLTQLEVSSDMELSSLYSGAEIYVQPSLAEGFGLPVLEAMQCKVPVVTSNVTSLPEVGGSAAFYADPIAESLAEAVTTVLSLSPSEKKKKVDEAFVWSQSFSWHKTAQGTLAVYESIL